MTETQDTAEYKPIVCYGCKAQTVTKDNSFELPRAAGWGTYQNRYWCNICSKEAKAEIPLDVEMSVADAMSLFDRRG